MFQAKGKLFTKENNAKTKTQIIYSVRRYAEIESILHGRAEHGDWKNAEKLVEFIWFSLCFHFARRGTTWPCVLIIMTIK